MKHSLPLSTLVHQMAKNVRITKGNHNASYLLFAVNIFVWEKNKTKQNKNKLGRGTLFPIFSEGSEGGVCTTQAIHRFYKTFWTSIRALRIQLQKNYSSTFLLFQKLYKVESVIAIKR